MIVCRSGLTIRMPVKDIRVAGRATQGVKLISIKDGDAIAALSVVVHTEEENGEETTPAEPQEGNDNN